MYFRLKLWASDRPEHVFPCKSHVATLGTRKALRVRSKSGLSCLSWEEMQWNQNP